MTVYSDPMKRLLPAVAVAAGTVSVPAVGLIATNAKPTTTQARRVVEHGGSALTIPAHTMGDGDTTFAVATGSPLGEANVSLIGGLAAEMMADAILRGVREATGLPNIPAVRDLRRP